jgi:TRAP-type transport system small permease protein
MNTQDVQRATSTGRMRWLVAVERGASAGLLLMILGTMSAQVVARYLLHAPISWSEEWARFTLIWLAFLAAAMVMAQGQHIAVDVISPWLGSTAQRWLQCLQNAVVVLACLLLLIGGFRFVWRVGLVGSPALGIPRSYWYGAASVGLGLIAVHGVANILSALGRDRSAIVDGREGEAAAPHDGSCS